MKIKDLTGGLFAVLLCLAVGNIGTIYTVPNISTWYATLNRPPFSPPNWLFGPAWTLLYILMGIAIYLIIKQGLDKKEVQAASLIFLIQLVLNAIWTPIFFGLHQTLLAFIVIVFLWLAIIWTMIRFYPISKLACWLLLPYLMWVTFASTLNFSFWWLNR
jgi:tryptophan-rich sensory protein